MWWKILSVLLILYTLLAGLLVPLKSGIESVSPEAALTGKEVSLRMHGYNSFFMRATPEPIRAWLTFDAEHAIAATAVRPVDDTTLVATFQVPGKLPGGANTKLLNVIVDHPTAGTSILPQALEVRQDTGSYAAGGDWTSTPVRDLHVQKGFSFPYQNVIYESIRNTYYHVPMWFALMFLFLASAWQSIRYLRKPDPLTDQKAVAYTEMGLLFGILGLVTGMVWANYTWGAPWSNDVKQTMTAVALLIYCAYFILRRSFDEPEKGARLAAVYNIFAFAALIPLLYIVPRMVSSLHPGATGNPAFGSQDLDNTMRMVFYPAIIGWTLLGFWIGQLRYRSMRIEAHLLGED